MLESYMHQLVEYILKNISKGYTIESLRWALINQGYSRSQIDKAVKIVNQELAKKAPILKEKPMIKMQREPLLVDIEPEKYTFSDKFKDFFKSFIDIFKS